MTLLRNRIKEEKIIQYHMGQTFFLQIDPGVVVYLMFSRVVGRCLLSGGGLPEDIEFI